MNKILTNLKFYKIYARTRSFIRRFARNRRSKFHVSCFELVLFLCLRNRNIKTRSNCFETIFCQSLALLVCWHTVTQCSSVSSNSSQTFWKESRRPISKFELSSSRLVCLQLVHCRQNTLKQIDMPPRSRKATISTAISLKNVTVGCQKIGHFLSLIICLGCSFFAFILAFFFNFLNF